MKTCIACKEEKDESEFPPNKSTKDKLNRKCRPCFNQYMKEWYSKNKDIHKARVNASRPHKSSKYGISEEEYETLINKFNGKCHLCKKKNATDIDHCHKTNKVRGVLCSGCNTSLGKLGDTVESLQKAVDYLAGG